MRKHLSFVQWSGLLVCIVSLLFVSCENIFKGAEIREQFREAIEIANSESRTYYVIVEEGSGKATPDYVRVKKNERFTLMFTPSDEWKFISWEAIDRTTGNVIPDAITFDNPKSTETKAKIINPLENLAIHAKCVAFPAVASVSPSSEAAQKLYTPIEITFNRSMQDQGGTAAESLLNYNNISITYGSTKMNDFFEQPYFKFGTDNKTLVIEPKSRELESFMRLKTLSTLKLNVELNQTIYVLNNDVPLYLTASEKNLFQITYNKEIDDVKPQTGEDGYLYFSRKPSISLEETNNHFVQETILNSEDKILKNRTNGTVYIYGKYLEAGSGVKSVTVGEKYSFDQWGRTTGTNSVVNETQYMENSENAVFTQDGNYTIFCIEHHISYGAGKILLQVTVSDFCGNDSDKVELSVIHTTSKNFLGFDVYNGGPYANQYSGENAFSISEFITSNFNKLRICTLHPFTGSNCSEMVYYGDTTGGKSCYIDLSALTVTCTVMKNNQILKTETLEPESSTGWSVVTGEEMICDLGVDTFEGLRIIITIKDDFDNKKEMDFTFPDVPVFSVTGETDDTMTLKFITQTAQQIAIMHEEIENGVKVEKWSGISNNTVTINKGTDYIARTLYINGDYLLVSDATPVFNVDKLTVPDNYTVPAVELESQNAGLSTGETYLSIGTWGAIEYIPQLNVTVNLKKDVWTKNKYDSIYMTWGKVGTTTAKEYFFPKNATEFTFQCYTKDLAASDYVINVYGVKNCYKSTPSIIQVSKITNPELDNVVPTLSKNTSYTGTFETFTYTFKDTITYPKSAYLVGSNGRKYTLFDNADNTQQSVTIQRPFWYFREEEDLDNRIQFEITDTAGNTAEVRLTGFAKNDITFTKDYNSNGWTFTPSGKDYMLYTWNSTTNKWNTPSKKNTTNRISLTTNSFVKVYVVSMNGTNITGCGAPQYFYITTATITSQPENRYIASTNSRNSVFVASDCDALIYTVGTKKGYSECSSWTAEQWNDKHFETGEAVYKFTSSDRYQKLYTIPVDQVIEAGCSCYAVLVHFADGTSMVSEVFELF